MSAGIEQDKKLNTRFVNTAITSKYPIVVVNSARSQKTSSHSEWIVSFPFSNQDSRKEIKTGALLRNIN